MAQRDISFVIPVHNEEHSLEELHRRLAELSAGNAYDGEIIFVDDGSTDGSVAVLRRLAAHDPRTKVIRLRRNYGQTAALSAGIRASGKSVVVTLDADMQNDPADIPALLAELDTGVDVVSGWRRDRKDRSQKVFSSRLANRLISRVTGVALSDYGCTLKAYRREFLRSIPLYGEMHRFIPVFAAWHGAKITEIPVHHLPREHGTSHYGIAGRTVRVMLDLLTVKFLHTFISRPMHFFGGVGMIFLGIGVLSAALAVFFKMTHMKDFISTPLPLFSVFFFLLGIQSMLLGLLAELLIRIYFDQPGRQSFEIAETLN
jgi:dolichol-phosphate mannosyltransferase